MATLSSAFVDDEHSLVRSTAAELRSIAAGGRNLTDLRSLDLPTLDRLMKEAGLSREDLVRLVPIAVAALDDPPYRAAAQDLFPFPYTDAGWTKLAVRGKRAAERFGIGYDGFRRGSEHRTSRMDEVVRHVASALLPLVAVDDPEPPVLSPVDEVEDYKDSQAIDVPGREHPAGTGHGHRQRWRFAAAGLIAVLALAVVGAVRAVSRSGEARSEARSCSAAIGVLEPSLAKEPGADRLDERLRAVYERAGGEPKIGCVGGMAYRWQSLVVQDVVLDGVPNGAVLVSPNGVDVYLNRGALGSYHQIGGKDGDAAQTTGGLVVRTVEYADGHVEIELSTGTVLVAERSDAPFFWIPAAYVPWWRDHPELGLPAGNPLPSQRQDFQHGVVSLSQGSTGNLVARIVENREQELPTLESMRGHLLRQADATAWFVDDEGRRLWIPDGMIWDCLGGEAARVGPDLRGYAIASLPYGGQARC